MAFYNNADGTPEPPACTLLTGSTLTTVYTATDAAYTLDTATFVNPTGAAVTCELYWRQNGTAVDALIWIGSVKQTSVGGPGSLNENFPVRLAKGDIIKAKGANTVWINLILMRNPRMRSV